MNISIQKIRNFRAFCIGGFILVVNASKREDNEKRPAEESPRQYRSATTITRKGVVSLF